MFKELLDEAEAQKKLDQQLGETRTTIKDRKSTLKNKKNLLFLSKNRIESFKHVISNLLNFRMSSNC